jgi:hypothetical protein
MEAMDKGGDELLARDEWVAAGKRLFEAYEKDQDGKADLKALAAGLNQSLPPQRGPPGGFRSSMPWYFNVRDMIDSDEWITPQD